MADDEPDDKFWCEGNAYSGASALSVSEVQVTDNPVTHELLGPKGQVIRQWKARPPVGFQR